MASVEPIFRRPFREQLAALLIRLGNRLPTESWRDLRGALHDRAFVVAGATKAALLAELAEAVAAAVAEGLSIDEFRRRFDDIVARHGWHYRGPHNWRTRIVYATNAATSYAAGRLAQLREGGFRFWIYRHSHLSLEPRPEHLAWDGTALPPEDPWWRTHFPPNGWNCRCYVVGARDTAAARRLGATRFDRPTPPGDTRGIDEGWDHAPGATVADAVTALRERVESLPHPLSLALVREWITSETFRRWLENPDGSWAVVRPPQDEDREIGATVRIVEMSADTARKQREVHPELGPLEYLDIQRVIEERTTRVVEARNIVYVLDEPTPERGGYVLVVKTTRTGRGLWVTSFRRLSRREAERDAEITRLLRRRREG